MEVLTTLESWHRKSLLFSVTVKTIKKADIKYQ